MRQEQRRLARASELKEISEQATRVGFATFLATCVTAVFVAFGWVFGALWYCVRYCAVAVRYGYRQGARTQRVPAEGGER